MIPSILAALVASVLAVYCNSTAEAVHFALLMTFLCALGLGFWQYKRGWIPALLLMAGIVLGYFIVPLLHLAVHNQATFSFLSFISPFPCLFGGLMGSYFRKIGQGAS